ncbi:OLC1v1011249C1 [Oldenlandia corymbosa var. corymbosa]|uniref:OLC1v1011249C1 n=1 Tax=Oldenlandia corymbosa var. corymbosa TaxID=529605 RepID=A0AAV1DT79_OLDCO|nr:OLC1v1011249C1 [Oldenlandia corymbosa var. corymbosa]
MAPRKKTTVEPSGRVTRSSARVTRSGTRQAKLDPISPPMKKAKKSPKQPKAKTAKPSSSVPVEKQVAETDTKSAHGDGPKKTIIVEHCKQCNSFKTRALHVKQALEKDLDGSVTVVLNPDKPRKGCFEIREDGEDGETFISLLDMKRPFTPMKELDMDKVVSDIVDRIKA